MQRGQFEAMGLALIIVLVSLGLFLLLFFSIERRPDFADRYNREQLSQNVLDALLRTSADSEACPGLTVRDLLEDIAVSHRNPCASVEYPDSVSLFGNITQAVFTRVFDERGLHYRWSVMVRDSASDDTPDPLYPGSIHTTCELQEDQNDRPGQQILPLYPTMKRLELQLAICIRGSV